MISTLASDMHEYHYVFDIKDKGLFHIYAPSKEKAAEAFKEVWGYDPLTSANVHTRRENS